MQTKVELKGIQIILRKEGQNRVIDKLECHMYECLACTVEYQLKRNPRRPIATEHSKASRFTNSDYIQKDVADFLLQHSRVFLPVLSMLVDNVPIQGSPNNQVINKEHERNLQEYLDNVISECRTGYKCENYIKLCLYTAATCLNTPIYILCSDEIGRVQWSYYQPLFKYEQQPRCIIPYVTMFMSSGKRFFKIESHDWQAKPPKADGLVGMYLTVLEDTLTATISVPDELIGLPAESKSRLCNTVSRDIVHECCGLFKDRGLIQPEVFTSMTAHRATRTGFCQLVTNSKEAYLIVCQVLIRRREKTLLTPYVDNWGIIDTLTATISVPDELIGLPAESKSRLCNTVSRDIVHECCGLLIDRGLIQPEVFTSMTAHKATRTEFCQLVTNSKEAYIIVCQVLIRRREKTLLTPYVKNWGIINTLTATISVPDELIGLPAESKSILCNTVSRDIVHECCGLFKDRGLIQPEVFTSMTAHRATRTEFCQLVTNSKDEYIIVCQVLIRRREKTLLTPYVKNWGIINTLTATISVPDELIGLPAESKSRLCNTVSRDIVHECCGLFKDRGLIQPEVFTSMTAHRATRTEFCQLVTNSKDAYIIVCQVLIRRREKTLLTPYVKNWSIFVKSCEYLAQCDSLVDLDTAIYNRNVHVTGFVNFCQAGSQEFDERRKKVTTTVIASSAIGIVSGGMVIAGIVLAPVSFGASLGLSIAGGAIGVGTGATAGTARVIEAVKQNTKTKDVNIKQETIEEKEEKVVAALEKVQTCFKARCDTVYDKSKEGPGNSRRGFLAVGSALRASHSVAGIAIAAVRLSTAAANISAAILGPFSLAFDLAFLAEAAHNKAKGDKTKAGELLQTMAETVEIKCKIFNSTLRGNTDEQGRLFDWV